MWRGGGGRREEREEVEDLKEGKEEMDDWNRKRREMSRKRMIKKKEGSGRVMSLSLLNTHIYTISISIMCLG